MKIEAILAVCSSALVLGCVHTTPQGAVPEWQIQGNQIEHPGKSNVRYYFAGRHQVSCLPQHPKKDMGFWVSEDSGLTWSKSSSIPGFESAFVHPDSGMIFALILNESLDKLADGTLVQKGGHKLVMSQEGKTWKDITPSGGLLPNGYFPFPDPDHSSRVCVLDQTGELVVYQAMNDDLTEWNSCSSDEWEKKHSGWNWTGFYAEYAAAGPVAAAKHFHPGSTWKRRLREECHVQVSKRNNDAHDAFIQLKLVGNRDSVPLLIAALRRQSPAIEYDGKRATVCTTGHCIQALETLTGQKFGFEPDSWEEWWHKIGKNLPPEHFEPRPSSEDGEHRSP